jgi:predicted MFS family arabinose efflux permease
MASLPDLVPREKLEAANGLNLSGLHAAMLLSQGVSGLLYRLLGAPLLVAANAVAYLWAGFTELGIRTPDRPRADSPGVHPWHRFRTELAEGIRYVVEHRGLRTMLVVFTVLNFCVAPLLALMAFLVQDFMHLGPDWLGYLMACFGGGGLLGFGLASIIRVKGAAREAAVGGACVALSATIPLMLIFPSAGAEIALFFAAGVLNGFMNVHVNTLLQVSAPEELRGRVQSVSMTLSVGAMPLGMAIAGVLFDLSGGSFWLVIGAPGVLMFVVSALALLSRDYRGFLAGTGEPETAATDTR